MADVLNFTVNRAFDINGDPAPGAQAFFFDAGTSNPRTVFADAEGSIPHPSPLIANGEGVFPPVFSSGGGGVSVEMMDEDGVMLDGYPMPLAVRVPGEGFNASGIAFSPTGDIPATNVQDAIEKVQDNLIEPLADYGLGVTGNGPPIANINATDTPSGMYAYTTGTLGTFPAGVTAANGGVVTLWRRTNASAVMTLRPANTNAVYERRMEGSTWQPWYQGSVNYATGEQARLGTSLDTVINPSNLKAAFAAVGPPPMFAIRAWVNFKGTVPTAMRASGNIASIERTGQGRYTITFATAMPDTSYAIISGVVGSEVNADDIRMAEGSKTTTSFGITVGAQNAYADSAEISVAVIR